jgi:hypothetical protein
MAMRNDITMAIDFILQMEGQEQSGFNFFIVLQSQTAIGGASKTCNLWKDCRGNPPPFG